MTFPYGAPDSAFYCAAEVFLRELEQVTSEFENGILPRESLEIFGHRMRGAAGVFGATEVESAAAALEQACRVGMAAPACDVLISAMIEALRRDARRLRLILGEHLPAPPKAAHPAATARPRVTAGREGPRVVKASIRLVAGRGAGYDVLRTDHGDTAIPRESRLLDRTAVPVLAAAFLAVLAASFITVVALQLGARLSADPAMCCRAADLRGLFPALAARQLSAGRHACRNHRSRAGRRDTPRNPACRR